MLTAFCNGSARIWPIDPLPIAVSQKPRSSSDRERETFEAGALAKPLPDNSHEELTKHCYYDRLDPACRRLGVGRCRGAGGERQVGAGQAG